VNVHDNDDEFPHEKLSKLLEIDIPDLPTFKANLTKPMVPKQLDNMRISDTIWEASDILNIDFDHRWNGIKSRFQATLACLIWKIVDPKQNELIEAGASTLADSLAEARRVMKPVKKFYLWDALHYMLPSSEKIDTIHRVGDELKGKERLFPGQFRSIPPLSSIPDRGGMLEGLSKEVIKSDVCRANMMMRQGNKKSDKSPQLTSPKRAWSTGEGQRGSRGGGNSSPSSRGGGSSPNNRDGGRGGRGAGASSGPAHRNAWGRGRGSAAAVVGPKAKSSTSGYTNQDKRNLL